VRRGLAIGGLAIVAAAGAGWAALNVFGRDAPPRPVVSAAVPAATVAAAPAAGGGDAVEVAGQDGPVDAGVTPMAQRVAVLGLLNKRNGVSRDITIRPGQAMRFGDVIVRLRACEQTAPWENEHLTGAFVQMDAKAIDGHWRRAFSGWLYKERPALNVVLHPVYDVWTKSCTMAFPGTAAAPAPSGAARASIAKKSPGAGSDAADGAGGGDAAGGEAGTTGTLPDSASPSNVM
jgi:hypothetical protein